jgi:hypothetical protein
VRQIDRTGFEKLAVDLQLLGQQVRNLLFTGTGWCLRSSRTAVWIASRPSLQERAGVDWRIDRTVETA